MGTRYASELAANCPSFLCRAVFLFVHARIYRWRFCAALFLDARISRPKKGGHPNHRDGSAYWYAGPSRCCCGHDRAPLAMATANPSSLLFALDPSFHVGWFYRHNRRIFFSERLAVGQPFTAGCPISRATDLVLRRVPSVCSRQSAAPLGLSFVVSSSFLVLRRILLRRSGGACARLVPRHDHDHADRYLHYFSTDHARRRRIS